MASCGVTWCLIQLPVYAMPFYEYSFSLLIWLQVFLFLAGTSLAAKFLRANGITLFKVREETVNLLGKSDLYFFSPEHPPLTEPAQRALDWAVDEKIKSGSVQYLFLDCWLLALTTSAASICYNIDPLKLHSLLSLDKF